MIHNSGIKSFIALGLMMSQLDNASKGENPFDEESLRQQVKLKDSLIEDSQRRRYGQNKFYYGDNFVWARNKKNADRKARNAGYLL